VTGTAEVSTDVAMVARRSVVGVLKATREIDGHIEEVAKIDVASAIYAASIMSNTAVNAVSEMLVGVAFIASLKSRSTASPDGAGRPERCKTCFRSAQARFEKRLLLNLGEYIVQNRKTMFGTSHPT